MVVKIKQIPTNPYSSGDNKRARTRPVTNVTPCPNNASAALQPTPFIVLFLQCLITSRSLIISAFEENLNFSRQLFHKLIPGLYCL